ncbi:hypothetical protein V8C35DRAFT_315129 [Trichoderma chlorosporum]
MMITNPYSTLWALLLTHISACSLALVESNKSHRFGTRACFSKSHDLDPCRWALRFPWGPAGGEKNATHERTEFPSVLLEALLPHSGRLSGPARLKLKFLVRCYG